MSKTVHIRVQREDTADIALKISDIEHNLFSLTTAFKEIGGIDCVDVHYCRCLDSGGIYKITFVPERDDSSAILDFATPVMMVSRTYDYLIKGYVTACREMRLRDALQYLMHQAVDLVETEASHSDVVYGTLTIILADMTMRCVYDTIPPASPDKPTDNREVPHPYSYYSDRTYTGYQISSMIKV